MAIAPRPFSRALTVVGATLALALGFTGLTAVTAPEAAVAAAAPAFDCLEPRFFAQAGGASATQLNSGSYNAAGQSVWQPLGAQVAAPNLYNALAFNPIDEYLYGTQYNSTVGQFVRVDRAGVVTRIGDAAPALGTAASTLWDSGEFDSAGTYYVASGNAGGSSQSNIRKVTGLSGATATSTPRPALSTVTLTPKVAYADFTFKAGFLWAASYNANTSIYRIDVNGLLGAAGTVTAFASPLPRSSYGSAFTMTNGNLAFIGTNERMYQVAVANPATANPTFELVNTVTAPTNSYSDATNCSTALPASLSVTKTPTSPRVIAGQRIGWTATVTNDGPGISSGFVLTDALPTGLANIAVTSADSSCVVNPAQTTAVCNGGRLAVGEKATVTITATAPATVGSVVNSVRVVGNEDPNPDAPTTSLPTEVILATTTNTAIAYRPETPAASFAQPQVAGSRVTLSGGSFGYTPAPGYSGFDSFSYVPSAGGSAVAVTIAVVPVGVLDSAATAAGQAVSVDVAGAGLGSGLVVDRVGDGTHGTARVAADGTVVYTPANPAFSGTDSFSYTLRDAASGLVAEAVTVTVTIRPVAVLDEASTPVGRPVAIDVVAEARGTGLRPTAVGAGAHGTTAVNAAGAIVYTPTDPDYAGTDTFTYTVTDAGGRVSDAVTVTVTMTPAATVAGDDVASTTSGTAVRIDLVGVVLANDTGTAVSVRSVEAASAHGGTVTRNAGGDFVYTPARGFSGTDSFEYTLSGAGGTDTATVTVTVRPVAVLDAASTRAGRPVAIDVVAEARGTGLRPTAVSAGAHGTTAVNAAGAIVYTPADRTFVGTDTISYTVTDSEGLVSAPITLTVTITAEATVAGDDVASTTSGTAVRIDLVGVVLANDSGTAVSVRSVQAASANGGAITRNAGGDFVYTPARGFSGTDSFEYTLAGAGGTDTAKVTVTVRPVAVLDAASTTAGRPVAIDVVAAARGTALDATGVTAGAHGTTAVNAAGAIVYTPTDPDYWGTDSFQYTVTDADGTVSASVAITVTIAPASTVAGDDAASTTSGSPVTIGMRDVVLVNDSGTAIGVVSVQPDSAKGGTVARTAKGDFVYTPADGFSGIDTFDYKLAGAGGIDTATVTVTVRPVAVLDRATTAAGTAVAIDVVSGAHGSGLGATGVTTGTHGRTILDRNGAILYTPTDPGFSGVDTFSYTLTGTGGTVSAPITVVVTIAPVAVVDGASTEAGSPAVIDVVTDARGSDVTATDISAGSHGSTALDADGSIVYTPTDPRFSGSDSFSYTVTDAAGTVSAPITVAVTVRPVAVADAFATTVDVARTIPVATIVANDRGRSLAFALDTSVTASNGSVALDSSGDPVFTPAAGYSGLGSFGYTVTDSAGQTTTAVVTVLIAPLAPDDIGSTVVGEPVTVDVLGNDVGTGFRIARFTQPAHGSVVERDGSLVFTPRDGWSGIAKFTYTSLDGTGSETTATVTVIVAPRAGVEAMATSTNAAVTFSVLDNDAGTDLVVSFPRTAHGAFEVHNDGTVTFTPAEGYSGRFRVAYTVTDAEGLTATAAVAITVDPVANHDAVDAVSGSQTTVAPLANDRGTALVVTATTAPGHGTITVNADGTIGYRSAAGFVGEDSFGYTAIDADGLTARATVTVTVSAAASVPAAGAVAGRLAFTGGEPADAALAALLLVLLGGALVVAGRRTHRAGLGRRAR